MKPALKTTTFIPIVFLTGCCALIYQMVWMRELRLVFGSSTTATSAVLAIFMGGLGLGGLVLGRRADRHTNPVKMFGQLEGAIAVLTLITPFLITLVRQLFITMGGTQTLGYGGAVTVRLLMSAVVLGLPTFLMGGTLPAIAKGLEEESDQGRRDLGLLYGSNTAGGVLGVILTTFYLLEHFGNRMTLWSAAAVNLCVAALVLLLASRSRIQHQGRGESSVTQEALSSALATPAPLVYSAAFLVGLVFFVMEMVWYRMLAPILGGTTFTFGLVLAMALTGIGLGGWLFGAGSRSRQATLTGFAVSCAVEGLCLSVAFFLGDQLAVLAALFKPLTLLGMWGKVLGWSMITGIVVLPAAIVAGYQFPLLISLLGRGSRDLGRHTGMAYCWNTLGAISGALLGGFFLLPLLSAPGCWRLMAGLLLTLSVIALGVSMVKSRRAGGLLALGPIVVSALFCLTSEGPTAVWRHSSIGSGQADLTQIDANGLRAWKNEQKRRTIWEQEGRESSVAMQAYDGLAFIINGKPDGNAVGDAGTQVMAPLVGAALHENPQKSLVIGLGTGSSAGWLAEIDSMQQVDVVEMEPAILEVARLSSPVNHAVLDHPKVKVIIGDGREVVLTSREQYDLIFSEPSNPYRAGISSLYTKEFYTAVKATLADGGIFSQWVQTYYVDARTIRTIYATLATVFPSVEIWLTDTSDMLFVCSSRQTSYSLPALRQRVNMDPFRTALKVAWGVTDLEGFLAPFVAGAEAGRRMASQEIASGTVNTDDLPLSEFSFARTVGASGLFSANGLRSRFRKEGAHRLSVTDGEVDWDLVDGNYPLMMVAWIGNRINDLSLFTPENAQKVRLYHAFLEGNFSSVLNSYRSRTWSPLYPLEMAILAEALADSGDPAALPKLAIVEKYWPGMAYAISARLSWRQQETEQAADTMAKALAQFTEDPWQNRAIMVHSLNLVMEMAAADETVARMMFDHLAEPFAGFQLEEYRKFARTRVAASLDCQYGVEAMSQWEPHIPWNDGILRYRSRCYSQTGSPLAARAEKDLQVFLDNLPDTVSN